MLDLIQSSEFQTALQSLLPAAVGCGVQQATSEAESFEYQEEGSHLANAVLARRNEFITGRRCARMALAQIGQVSCALPKDADGLPIWPAATMGSITHSRGLCCAVAASADEMMYLGVDLEKTNRLSARAMKRVLHPLEAVTVGESQALGSLLFSAKEAYYKAQFPIWGAQPNFKDLALQIHSNTQQLTVLKIAQNLPVQLRDATQRMKFRYQFMGDYVLTLCWLELRPKVLHDLNDRA
ncbi:MAG: 4'-phosphopantetheinyl transferase superfamily protein [Opitutae bacterium]|nr:4'-phosphopantetheinyl transferase superfamily protein [Opitutae bacterium]